MKKYVVIILSISCILLLVGCSKAGNNETIAFHDKTFNKADLSQETIEWLYGTIPNGKYRIGKEIMDFKGPGDYDNAIYFAEFEIK